MIDYDIDAALRDGATEDIYLNGVRTYTANRGIWEGCRRISLPGCEGANIEDVAACHDVHAAAKLLRRAAHCSYPSGGWSVESLPACRILFKRMLLVLPAEDNRKCGMAGVHGV